MLNWGQQVSARGFWRFPSQLGVGGRGRPIGPYNLYCDEKTSSGDISEDETEFLLS